MLDHTSVLARVRIVEIDVVAVLTRMAGGVAGDVMSTCDVGDEDVGQMVDLLLVVCAACDVDRRTCPELNLVLSEYVSGYFATHMYISRLPILLCHVQESVAGPFFRLLLMLSASVLCRDMFPRITHKLGNGMTN